MKIVIDDSPLHNAHASRGIGIYTRNVIRSLQEAAKEKSVEVVSCNLLKQQTPPNTDIVIYTYFDLFRHTLHIDSHLKTIVVIHDVTPLIYPRFYPSGVRGKINFELQKHTLRKVHRVVTVSQTSKKDIVRLLGIPAEKINVIYNASQSSFIKLTKTRLDLVRKRFGLPKKYVLYVGDVNWNKNIIRLVKACILDDLPLVIVGKQAVSTDYDKNHIETQPLRELQEVYGNNTAIMRLGYLDDEEFAAVWQLATVYCQPSIYEGFGIPVVEAFQVGIPVVSSKTQALVEVAGDAAYYVDPYSEQSIAEGLNIVIENSDVRNQLVKLGNERSQLFSWNKSSIKLLSVCEKIFNEG